MNLDLNSNFLPSYRKVKILMIKDEILIVDKHGTWSHYVAKLHNATSWNYMLTSQDVIQRSHRMRKIFLCRIVKQLSQEFVISGLSQNSDCNNRQNYRIRKTKDKNMCLCYFFYITVCTWKLKKKVWRDV